MDVGMSELLVIGIVALIVIGPKDLPVMFRTFGRFTAKLRAMAGEFSRAMEAAADESGVKDVAKDLRAVTSPKAMGLDKVREAAERFEKWDPAKPRAAANPAKAVVPTAQPAAAVEATPAVAAPPVAASLVTTAAPAAEPAPKPQRKAVRSTAAKRAAPKAAAADPAPAVKKPRAPRKPKSDTPKADA